MSSAGTRVPRHGRRRAAAVGLVVGTVAVVAMATSWPAFGAGAASRPVDRDFDDYVLFAREHLSLKGGQGASRGWIRGGDVGVNNPHTGAHGASLSICANAHVHLDDESQVVGDVVHGDGNECDFWDLYANKVTGSPKIVPRNSGPSAFTLPIIPDSELPDTTTQCNRQAAYQYVSTGSTLHLPPGTYGSLRVRDGGTLYLDGEYTFCNFEHGKRVRIYTTDATIVHVADAFGVSNGSYVGPSCDAWFLIDSQEVDAHDSSAHFSKKTTIYGRFWAPNGQMNLGHTTHLHGQYGANRIASDWNTNVDGCPPDETTTTTTGPTTTTADGGTTTTTGGGTTTTTGATTTTGGETTTSTTETTVGTQGSTSSTPGSQVTTGGGDLPRTGSGSGLFLAGFAAVVGGATLLALARRRKLLMRR